MADINSNKRRRFGRQTLPLILVGTLAAGGAMAQQAASNEELAKQLANPIAALISLPIQLNYDQNIGPDEAGR